MYIFQGKPTQQKLLSNQSKRIIANTDYTVL